MYYSGLLQSERKRLDAGSSLSAGITVAYTIGLRIYGRPLMKPGGMNLSRRLIVTESLRTIERRRYVVVDTAIGF